MTRETNPPLRSSPVATHVVVALVALATNCVPPTQPCEDMGCAPVVRFAAGTTPNDVKLSTCGGRPVAVVPDSAEAAVHVIDLHTGDVVATTHFPPLPGIDGDRFASPWAVAVTEDGQRAAVTLFGQDLVAWIDPCAGVLLDVAPAPGARTPQPVVVSGGHVLVAYPNIRRFGLQGAPPELDAGEVVSFAVRDDTLEIGGRQTLPCTNPQGLALNGAVLFASCSGPLTSGPDGGQEAIADGALVRLDAATLAISSVMHAGRLAPGTPAVAGGRVIVGSLVDPLVCIAELAAEKIEDCTALEGPEVEAIFEVVRWNDSTLLATQFSRDALHVLTLGADGLRPATAIQIGPGGTAFRGLLAIDVAPDRSPDAVGLLGLSAEVVPLSLHVVIP